jgi:hypothetical protein
VAEARIAAELSGAAAIAALLAVHDRPAADEGFYAITAEPSPTVSIEAGTGRLPSRFASQLSTASSIEEFNGDQS